MSHEGERADMSTENVIVEQLQTFLRNDQNAFMYGRSVNNQRIEAWWGILRRECAQFWINEIGRASCRERV